MEMAHVATIREKGCKECKFDFPNRKTVGVSWAAGCRLQQEEAAMSATGKPILYSKWFSSCSQRVRIALNLKGKCVLATILAS
jgi:hypothetical protein